MEKRYLAMWMWLCEGKLTVKIAHFRLPSASQKRACLSSLITGNILELTSDVNLIFSPQQESCCCKSVLSKLPGLQSKQKCIGRVGTVHVWKGCFVSKIRVLTQNCLNTIQLNLIQIPLLYTTLIKRSKQPHEANPGGLGKGGGGLGKGGCIVRSFASEIMGAYRSEDLFPQNIIPRDNLSVQQMKFYFRFLFAS